MVLPKGVSERVIQDTADDRLLPMGQKHYAILVKTGGTHSFKVGKHFRIDICFQIHVAGGVVFLIPIMGLSIDVGMSGGV